MPRQWIALRDDQSDVGGAALTKADSVSFRVDGEVRRRSGLTKVATGGAIYMGHIRSLIGGSSIVLVQSDGTVDSVAL